MTKWEAVRERVLDFSRLDKTQSVPEAETLAAYRDRLWLLAQVEELSEVLAEILSEPRITLALGARARDALAALEEPAEHLARLPDPRQGSLPLGAP